ncbi:hypothetical protein Tco_1321279 [Tanacetum coccineum]
MASVSNTISKLILIPDDGFSDNASSSSVAQKFLNEVKDKFTTLQSVVKSKMSLNVNNWSSTFHQEVHKILKDEIALIVNQVDARIINFEKQFLKESDKFVGEFKSLTKEADESLDMNKGLEYENERLLRAVVSQDILSSVQNNFIVDTSNLQTELELDLKGLVTVLGQGFYSRKSAKIGVLVCGLGFLSVGIGEDRIALGVIVGVFGAINGSMLWGTIALGLEGVDVDVGLYRRGEVRITDIVRMATGGGCQVWEMTGVAFVAGGLGELCLNMGVGFRVERKPLWDKALDNPQLSHVLHPLGPLSLISP